MSRLLILALLAVSGCATLNGLAAPGACGGYCEQQEAEAERYHTPEPDTPREFRAECRHGKLRWCEHLILTGPAADIDFARRQLGRHCRSDGRACFVLAKYDPANAHELTKLACVRNYADACYVLGTAADVDPVSALRYLERACIVSHGFDKGADVCEPVFDELVARGERDRAIRVADKACYRSVSKLCVARAHLELGIAP